MLTKHINDSFKLIIKLFTEKTANVFCDKQVLVAGNISHCIVFQHRSRQKLTNNIGIFKK